MSISIICPVSKAKVNENTVRVSALLVLIINLIGLFLNSPVVFLLLSIDFGLRAFTTGKWSAVKYFSRTISYTLALPSKPIDAAPKKFAAGIGALFSIAITIALILQITSLTFFITGILSICAILEGAGGICIACYIYSILPPYFRS